MKQQEKIIIDMTKDAMRSISIRPFIVDEHMYVNFSNRLYGPALIWDEIFDLAEFISNKQISNLTAKELEIITNWNNKLKESINVSRINWKEFTIENFSAYDADNNIVYIPKIKLGLEVSVFKNMQKIAGDFINFKLYIDKKLIFLFDSDEELILALPLLEIKQLSLFSESESTDNSPIELVEVSEEDMPPSVKAKYHKIKDKKSKVS